MKSVSYEKPSMKFVDLRSEQSIAADGPCMPQASHGSRDFFYDRPGDGWVQIRTQGENCNGNTEFIIYIDNPAVEGTADYETQQEAIAAASASIQADKQAFSGAVYAEPDPSWS